MNIYCLASGSKGNSTLIEHHGHYLLIDMGVSFSYLKKCLDFLNVEVNNIDALLITHNHSDHISGVKYLRNTPIFCTEGTYSSNSDITYIQPYQKYHIIGLEVRPVSLSHDAINPVGFVIKSSKEKLVYITDTGMLPSRTLRYLKNANYYVFEANHNQKMLHQTLRPADVKLRILSDLGHLSNEDSAMYLSTLIGDKTTDIILAHISSEANTPELAIKAYQKIFKKVGLKITNYHLQVAEQFVITSIINQ